MKHYTLTLIIAAASAAYGCAIGFLFLKGDVNRQKADLTALQSETSHLRNLNWLLARQIEQEKGGEQLNPAKP